MCESDEKIIARVVADLGRPTCAETTMVDNIVLRCEFSSNHKGQCWGYLPDCNPYSWWGKNVPDWRDFAPY